MYRRWRGEWKIARLLRKNKNHDKKIAKVIFHISLADAGQFFSGIYIIWISSGALSELILKVVNIAYVSHMMLNNIM